MPGTLAQEDELEAWCRRPQELGTGVFEVVPRGMDGEISVEAHAEIDWMADLRRRAADRYLLAGTNPYRERPLADLSRSRGGIPGARRAALSVGWPSTRRRSLFGLQSQFTPFSTRPTFQALESLPFAERFVELRKPEVRAKILAEPNGRYRSQGQQDMHENFANMYRMAWPINWEPRRDETMTALAEKAGMDVEAYFYDYMLGDEGQN